MHEFRLAPPSSSILLRLPWLLDANSWSLTSRGDEHPAVNDRGVWPVGNGHVFAHAGLAKPFNRLQGIVGPTYQTEGDHRPEGAFGDCWIELRHGDATVEFAEQHIWRPRASGVLITVGVAENGIALVVVDCAPPGPPLIVRMVEVWQPAPDSGAATLVVRAPHCRPLPGDAALGGSHRNQSLVICSGVGPAHDVSIAGDGLAIVVECSAAVERATVLLATGYGLAEAQRVARQVGDPSAALLETRDFWSGWLADTRTPALWAQDCPGRTGSAVAVQDLVESVKIALKMQQALPGGAVSPMVHFKGVWARDSSGPVRAFLAMGAFAEARALLEYYYRVTVLLGRLPNSAPLDLAVGDATAPADWNDIAIPHAETPSHIVLQHLWWFQAGGDVELIGEHWHYLHRCATGQGVGDAGLLAFNGDETYLHGALYSVFPERCGWPNDLIAEDGEHGYSPWSLESGVLYVAANEAMALMAEALGKPGGDAYRAGAGRVREVIEKRFWLDGYYAPALYPLTGEPHRTPFAPINLKALWAGYHSGDSERARADLAAVVDLVGFTGTTPSCGWGVGTTPSLLLHALLETASDLAPYALASLVAMASPAGEWAEVYAPGGRPGGGYAPETPNRLRPWESGLALSAIYRYFETRRAGDEPPLAEGSSRPAGRVLPARYPDPEIPGWVVLVTSDPGDRKLCEAQGMRPDEMTVLEIGAPIPVDYFDRVLFDPIGGGRRVDRFVLGKNVTVPGRRSMKTLDFWQSGGVTAALERFAKAGGQIVEL